MHASDHCTITVDEMPVDGAGSWRLHFDGQVSRVSTDVVVIANGELTLDVP